jgi:hypothetical protein
MATARRRRTARKNLAQGRGKRSMSTMRRGSRKTSGRSRRKASARKTSGRKTTGRRKSGGRRKKSALRSMLGL